MPIKFRFVLIQATPVEPLPIVKSRTVSPSFVYVLIRYSSRATGFCVGCVDLFFCIEPLYASWVSFALVLCLHFRSVACYLSTCTFARNIRLSLCHLRKIIVLCFAEHRNNFVYLVWLIFAKHKVSKHCSLIIHNFAPSCFSHAMPLLFLQ